jgi:hypothetical protein
MRQRSKGSPAKHSYLKQRAGTVPSSHESLECHSFPQPHKN